MLVRKIKIATLENVKKLVGMKEPTSFTSKTRSGTSLREYAPWQGGVPHVFRSSHGKTLLECVLKADRVDAIDCFFGDYV